MSKPSTNPFKPSEVRAHFILRGTTYTAWGRARGFHKSTLCKLISGQHKGLHPVTKRMRLALEKELQRN